MCEKLHINTRENTVIKDLPISQVSTLISNQHNVFVGI